jgi:hypothetical protein
MSSCKAVLSIVVPPERQPQNRIAEKVYQRLTHGRGGEVSGRADKPVAGNQEGPFPSRQRLSVRHGFESTEFVVQLHNQPQGGLAMRRTPTEVRVARGNGFTRWLGGRLLRSAATRAAADAR